jgi:MoaA/NifB/PqqE/SkfB family radical SAM enzyme/SAM-dependent methyltransferase
VGKDGDLQNTRCLSIPPGGNEGGLNISKTACIIPWTNFVVRPDGSAHFCCDVLPNLKVNGRPGNLSRDSLDDLWNADELVSIRSAMARGEKPASCNACWKQEAKGGSSRRLLINPVYRDLRGGLAVEKLAAEGAATGYRLERKPDWFVLELGNVCNLKCRSCNPLSSSRVAADRVQVAWTGQPPPTGGNGTWFKQIDELAEMIADAGHETSMLSLMGGEPFLIEQTWQLLEQLVERGVARGVYVGLSTNGQQRSAKLEHLAPQFRGFNVSVSVDGYGKLNDYLRHGADWPALVGNLDWLRAIPNVDVAIVPTLQNGNALDLPALLRFADARDLPLAYNVVSEPARLRPANLPPVVRRIAARRLREYLDTECKPVNRGVVRAYCEILEEPGDAFDPELFREFATFTNDLDAARGESLRDAAPELLALLRVAGVEWPSDRRFAAGEAQAARSSFEVADLLRRVDRTVSPRDVIFSTGDAVRANWYFQSGADQIAQIDALLREHGHAGIAGSRAVADYASHYGRMTRVLRAALPHAAVYACDIDPGAVRFCAEQLGASPVVTGWRPDEEQLPRDLDAIVCVSLLTHTPLEHWRRTLRAWARMLRPGGAVAFTYLSEQHVPPWLGGEMEHYGSYAPGARQAAAGALRDDGFAFAALTTMYGDEPWYGIAFATADVVRREIEAAGLEVIALPGDANRQFAQDLVLARKAPDQPAESAAAPAPVPVPVPDVQRDVSVIAVYDPRCYAPASASEGDPGESIWARLATADPPAPLPTELGFGDPRVPELREAQAALAREHGVDAFCYRYAWGAGGPVWDAALRDLVASGRPDFPFCLAIAAEDGARIDPENAGAVFDGIADALADPRYLRVDGKPLVVVHDLTSFVHTRAVAGAWRNAAAERGVGELHLCARRPPGGVVPQELGFDAFLEPPEPDRNGGTATGARITETAAALAAPWPDYRFFRSVTCRRNTADPHAGEVYELHLHAAIDATRRRGEKLVFVDSWNDWLRGCYLEPDDRDGRAALLATRRAARGPASGLVLLRRLRDALGDTGPAASAVLGELEHVVALHEHTRDRLLAGVEAALARDRSPVETPARAVQIRPLTMRCHAYLDSVAGVGGEVLTHGPVVVRGDELRVTGWAHVVGYAPDVVEMFLALESIGDGGQGRMFRIDTRVARADVVATFPDYPPNCGYEVDAHVDGLAAGIYRIAIVQLTPDGRYRDVTAAIVQREEPTCSSD